MPESTQNHSNDVDAEGAHLLVMNEQYTYVDVREPDEFEEGRPASAINVPLAGDPSSFVERMKTRFASDAKVVVGCQSGKRSRRAVSALRDAGFTSVVECRTGWDGIRGAFGELREPGWKRVGLPTESGSPTRS
ncbi:MAG TPA: rhodanese-like domain-containing protein [Polyangiaceae bacterium]